MEDGPPRTVNSVAVESVDAALARATAAGGPMAMPKTAKPGVGYQAYITGPRDVLTNWQQEHASAS